MTPRETETFTAAVAADAELQAELTARRAERREFRRALGEEIPATDLRLAATAAPARHAPRANVRRFPLLRIGVALAASICLVILVPRMLRNDNGAEGPGSSLTISGQVAAVRFGEIPGETVVLETGAIELPAGLSRRLEARP